MKNKFTILGCGSSLGSPWITNYKGKLSNNIKNISEEDLITIFWINEHYNEDTSDTYLENV